LLASIFAYALSDHISNKNECCGIVGYLGKDPNAGKILSEGIKILEQRGYDSCGIVTIDPEKEFVLTKHAS